MNTQHNSEIFNLERQLDMQKHLALVQANELAALRAINTGLIAALLSVRSIAKDAFEAWDNDRDMRVGKILLALCGASPGYRQDTDAITAALAKAQNV